MNEPVFVGKHATTHSVQKHKHDEWELIYCTGGMGEVVFENGSTLQYAGGEIVAIPANMEHSNISKGGFTNIYMRLADATFPYRSAVKLLDDSGKPLYNFFNEAFYYFDSDLQRKELILDALGEVIASYIIAFLSRTSYSEPVETIRDCILRNYANAGYDLEKTLASIPLNYDYLRKCFKKEMGLTPHEYMTDMRMKKAEKLLSAMDGEYLIGEVAQMCGYNDPLYFTRVFKKRFGLSPTAFNKGSAEKSI